MQSQMVQNVNKTAFAKNCLLKYITVPFRSLPMYHRHQNMWQVPEIAKVVGEFGYNVDVIDYEDETVQLTNRYDLLIDIHPQFHKVYEGFLAENCIKVLYSTGSAPNWQNSKHLARVQALNARRGARLLPRAYVPPLGSELESFDAMFLIGNQFTLDTFGSLPIKQTHFIRNSAYQFADPDLSQKLPYAFLFLATYPQTLKGLDLLLEVFAKNPNLNLIICSQFTSELDFCEVYKKELFQTPNILSIGPIDITSAKFAKIRKLCSYVILPSCSEGMSGSVLTAMSAGLIPIVSRECGFYADEAFLLADCSIDCIEYTLREFAAKPISWIQTQARRSIELVRNKYTPEHFSLSFRSALQGLLYGNAKE